MLTSDKFYLTISFSQIFLFLCSYLPLTNSLHYFPQTVYQYYDSHHFTLLITFTYFFEFLKLYFSE